MAFYDDEISNRAQPAELYEFVGPTTTYRYTSHGYDIEFGGNTYTAMPMASSRISGDMEGKMDALEIEIDRGAQLVQDYAFVVAPRTLSCTVYRLHANSGNFQRWWGGKVIGISLEKPDVATLVVPSLMSVALETVVPTVFYQTHCNHVLYDARCAILSSAFDVATTITAISANEREITVASDGGNPDGWFQGGEIIGSDGDRRLILDHTGNVMTILWPFVAQAPMDNVTLYAGCDHSFATCVDKFSNSRNFGGHPHIPTDNPWRNIYGIRGQSNAPQTLDAEVQAISGGTTITLDVGDTVFPPITAPADGKFDGGTIVRLTGKGGIPRDILTSARVKVQVSIGTYLYRYRITVDSAVPNLIVGDEVRLSR